MLGAPKSLRRPGPGHGPKASRVGGRSQANDLRTLAVSAAAIAIAGATVVAVVVVAPEGEGPMMIAHPAIAMPPPKRAATIPRAETALPTRLAPPPAAAVHSAPPLAAPRTADPPSLWRQNAVQAPEAHGRPMIAVVIDDMGIDRRRSARAVELPGPLTMAYITYARGLGRQTRAARARGHELIVHVPMEPDDGGEDPGPNVLGTGQDQAEVTRRLEWGLTRFSGYVGISNHMGSRFTADDRGMAVVMAALRRRGLLFLDSRTTADTVAIGQALKYGVPAASRDIFIDNELTEDAVRQALSDAEAQARTQGYAIAIGHPHDVTLDALAQWLPQLEARGIVLVPLSAIVARAPDLG